MNHVEDYLLPMLWANPILHPLQGLLTLTTVLIHERFSIEWGCPENALNQDIYLLPTIAKSCRSQMLEGTLNMNTVISVECISDCSAHKNTFFNYSNCNVHHNTLSVVNAVFIDQWYIYWGRTNIVHDQLSDIQTASLKLAYIQRACVL